MTHGRFSRESVSSYVTRDTAGTQQQPHNHNLSIHNVLNVDRYFVDNVKYTRIGMEGTNIIKNNFLIFYKTFDNMCLLLLSSVPTFRILKVTKQTML